MTLPLVIPGLIRELAKPVDKRLNEALRVTVIGVFYGGQDLDAALGPGGLAIG